MPAFALLLIALAATPTPNPPPLARDDFGARRDALRSRLDGDTVAVLLSAEPDAGGGFVQEPSFYYLTGLADVAGAALVLESGDDQGKETLYLQPRDYARERWQGPTLGPGALDASGDADAERQTTLVRTGFRAVRERSAFAGEVLQAVRRGAGLAIVTPATAMDAALGPELRLVRDIRDRAPRLQVHDLAPDLEALRLIKSPGELIAIRRAIAITIEAHREIAPRVCAGTHEYEIKARLEYVFRRAGCERPAFPSIVAGGPNATVLHYEGDRRALVAPELVVVDIGASWAGYAADITRTYPTGGKFGAEERRIYDIVLAAQEAALLAVKPGAKLRSDVHKAAKDVIAAAGYEKAFMHGTSHYVGLAVHDVGPRDGELRPGMVITVEPGIYLPEEGIGVRIEDMVLVTDRGYELLSAALPRTAEGVEGAMAATP